MTRIALQLDNSYDYKTFDSIAEAGDYLRTIALAEAGLGLTDVQATVYKLDDSTPMPWEVRDPYPDEAWTIGPRGGLQRTRA